MGIPATPPPEDGTAHQVVTRASETAEGKASTVEHRTRYGDTFWDISQKVLQTPFRWKEIAEDNGNINPKKLPVGITLTINLHPGDVTVKPGSGPVPSPGVKKKPPKTVVNTSSEASLRKSSSSASVKSQGRLTLNSSKAEMKAYAHSLLPRSQWNAFDRLIERESGWNPRATNKKSGAYGLPQALPGSKMRAAGADWRTNPATQLRWVIQIYIPQRYGTAVKAERFQRNNGWY